MCGYKQQRLKGTTNFSVRLIKAFLSFAILLKRRKKILYDRDDVIREMTYKYAFAVAVAYKLVLQTEEWLEALHEMRRCKR